MASCAIVAVSQVTSEFSPVVRNLVLIVTNIAVQAAIISKGRRHSHPYHQQNSSDRTFHIVFLPSPIQGAEK
jgi:hypothetical protein